MKKQKISELYGTDVYENEISTRVYSRCIPVMKEYLSDEAILDKVKEIYLKRVEELATNTSVGFRVEPEPAWSDLWHRRLFISIAARDNINGYSRETAEELKKVIK